MTEVEFTGVLRNARRISREQDPRGPCLSGDVYGDKKGRFREGERITTSTIMVETGDVFVTRFSAYRVESWAGEKPASFQKRVMAWANSCFAASIVTEKPERNHRFLEESLELVQSLGTTANEAHMLVDYVYGRPIGEPHQEMGGVMVTLALLAEVNNLDALVDGEREYWRITQPDVMAKIRAKQLTKPASSPLPGVAS